MTISNIATAGGGKGEGVGGAGIAVVDCCFRKLEKNILFIKILRQKISNLCQIAAPHDYQSV